MRITGFSALLSALGLTCALLFVTAVQAAGPAEPPPPDLAGAQYIDSTGCVFRRSGTDWQPLIQDGAPVCGYPPTLSARRTAGSDAADEPRPQRIARALGETIYGGLQDGELLPPGASGPDAAHDGADPHGPAGPSMQPTSGTGPSAAVPQRVADPPPASGGLPAEAADWGQVVASARQLRGDMARSASGDAPTRLCELIGAAPRGDAPSGPPMALGLCEGQAINLPGAVAGPTAATGAQTGKRQASAPASHPRPQIEAKRNRRPAVAHSPAGTKAVSTNVLTKKGKTTAKRPAAPRAATIPAGARYVQLGRFTDPADAARVSISIKGMGLPLSRLRGGAGDGPGGGQTLLVGPFDSREAIVRTLDRLRRAGYPGATAR